MFSIVLSSQRFGEPCHYSGLVTTGAHGQSNTTSSKKRHRAVSGHTDPAEPVTGRRVARTRIHHYLVPRRSGGHSTGAGKRAVRCSAGERSAEPAGCLGAEDGSTDFSPKA